MKKAAFLIIMLLAAVSQVMAQRTCPVCHGNRRIETRKSVSSYGTNLRKIQCRYCNQWIYSNESHWDTCYNCHGTGTVGGSSSGGTGQNRNSGGGTSGGYNGGSSYDGGILPYLDPADIPAFQNLMQLRVKGTKLERITCPQCNGSRTCRACQGSGMIFGTNICTICLGQRTCSACMGQGMTLREVPMTAAELADLDAKIKIYVDKASKRMAR